jgi:O-antigen/teichoic acid export membrane protein
MIRHIPKNYKINIIGTGLSQLVPLLFLPVLTRFNSPEAFGVFAIYSAVYSIITAIIGLRFDYFILFTHKKSDAETHAAISLMASATITLISFILFFFFKSLTASISIYYSYIAMLFLSSLMGNLFNVIQYMNNKYNNYRKYVFNKILFFSSISVFSTLFSIFLNDGGLIYGHFAGCLLTSILIIIIYKKELGEITKKINRKNINYFTDRASGYIKFTFSTIFGFAYFHIPNIFIPIIFGPTFGGHFTISYRLVSVPTSFISTPISEVYRSKISSFLKTNKDLFSLYKKTIIIAIIISISIFSFVQALNNPNYIVTALGRNWDKSSEIISVLIVFGVFKFVYGSVENTSVMLNKTTYNLYWNFLRSVLLLICFYTVNDFGLTAINFCWIFVGLSSLFYFFDLIAGAYFIKTKKPS